MIINDSIMEKDLYKDVGKPYIYLIIEDLGNYYERHFIHILSSRLKNCHSRSTGDTVGYRHREGLHH